MSDDNKVHVDLRTNFGKGFARRLRAEGKIPAVIYGHGTDPVHVALPGHQVSLIIRRANALLDLDIEGKSQLVLVKDVQKDPVRQIIEHIDLLVVKKGEKVAVEVPVVLVGESFSGTIVTQDLTTIKLEVEATHIPEHVEVSVEGLEEGAHITAGEVTLPKGASLLDDPEALLVAVSIPAAEVSEENAEEAETAAAPAESAEEAAAE
ncbi:50S ribosomal protein L25/general stress protein Ctc [Microbacterium sp. Mu-80]|uniref:Large ribosomal subunit protein bL25 n=1 Tax=Microbacterium bandirmense TaxID=3122050 RepID=A0ABU8LAN3_9MICO